MYTWLRRLFSDSPSAVPAVAPHFDNPEKALPPTARVRRFAAEEVSAMQRNQLDFIFSGWLFGAENHPDLFTNKNEDAILAALDEVVKSEQAGAHMVRRMPGVIPQLLQSLRSSDFDGTELARKISHDVVLVAEVLRLANSATYNRGTSITSIDHAVLILGHNGLRQLITGVAFKPIISLKSGSFTKKLAPRLWAQSERCAAACNILARDNAIDLFDAVLAGLIQNVGLTVSLRVIDKISDGRLPVGSPTFCNALASHGHALTLNIGREWQFPDPVMIALREQESDAMAAHLSPAGRILLMGDYLSKMHILARHRRVDTNDPAIVEGLSEKEIACLAELASLEDRDWSALATSASRGAAGSSE
jgi:HD-like signal output (HDOD) protein